MHALVNGVGRDLYSLTINDTSEDLMHIVIMSITVSDKEHKRVFVSLGNSEILGRRHVAALAHLLNITAGIYRGLDSVLTVFVNVRRLGC